MEILYSLLYAIFIGLYNVNKKFSLKKSNASTILALFTTCSLILAMLWIPFGISIPAKFVGIIAFKGFIISISWYITLKVLKEVDLSIVTVTQILSTVLVFISGLVIFKETAGVLQIIGSILIVSSAASINFISRKNKGNATKLQIALLLLVACISTTSNIIDKYTTNELTNMQVQFWFSIFVCTFSWLWFAIDSIKNKKLLITKSDLKNVAIYLTGLCLFIGDFCLFTAYKVPNSQMITITILANFKIVVSVFAGIFIFKEKNIVKKLLITLLVFIGVLLISLK